MTSGPSSWSPSSTPTRSTWQPWRVRWRRSGFSALLNRSGVYRVTPYVITGVVLWVCVHAGGLHATLAGVLLAAFIPTRKPPDYRALALQAEAILAAEASHGGEQFRLGPSEPALRELDAIHDRLESPADRLLRNVAPRSSYLVLPIFALANAGVVIAAEVLTGHGMLMAAIICGLAIGKPAGFILASWLAVKFGIAEKPAAYSWRQLARRRCAGGHRLHDVAVHCGAGVSRRWTILRQRRLRSLRRRCFRPSSAWRCCGEHRRTTPRRRIHEHRVEPRPRRRHAASLARERWCTSCTKPPSSSTT